MPLALDIRKKLIEKCNTFSSAQLLKYVLQEGNTADIELLLKDMKSNGLDVAKYQFVWNETHKTNPDEQAEWNIIPNNGDEVVRLNMLQEYVAHWSNSAPCGNHLQDAQREIARIIKAQTEEMEWRQVDLNNMDSILAYVGSHPDTAHKDELDDAAWNLIDQFDVTELNNFLYRFPNSNHKNEALENIDDLEWSAIDQSQIYALQAYVAAHPTGKHVNEASSIIAAFDIWASVKESRDVFMLKQYIENYKNSPFMQQSIALYHQLKSEILTEMKRERNQYDIAKLTDLINAQIFTVSELKNCNLITERSWEKFSNGIPLPDIKQVGTVDNVPSGSTDVFFFGIPATGKTCILMGVVNSSGINVDFARLGGDYANDLSEYVVNGKVPGSTYGTFCTAVVANIPERDKKNHIAINHPVNLIEMSGEEFAFQIAKNPDGQVSFEEMGSGATNILKNNNRKAIFVIIDPTADVRHVRRAKFSVDENGNEYQSGIDDVYVSQRAMLQKLMGLFKQPENADIANKIDAFNIILTKSDLLGDSVRRETEALTRVQNQYGNFISSLTDFCVENEINMTTGGIPKLYTFSLGTWYLGDVYNYDEADSNKIIQAIKYLVAGKGVDSAWDKICDFVNRPLF